MNDNPDSLIKKLTKRTESWNFPQRWILFAVSDIDVVRSTRIVGLVGRPHWSFVSMPLPVLNVIELRTKGEQVSRYTLEHVGPLVLGRLQPFWVDAR